jgi:DNA repair protein RecO (recombination protein O)
MSRSFSTQAIVLKRRAMGETDRLLTLLTQDRGKLLVLAKGARRLNSSNRANLEPGNLIQAFCIETKGPILLTQSRLLFDTSRIYQNLPQTLALKKIGHIQQILEIFDRLFVEEFIDEGSFVLAKEIEKLVLSDNNQAGRIKKLLNQLLILLGYRDIKDTKHQSIQDYVAEISEQKMKSFDFLNTHSRS